MFQRIRSEPASVLLTLSCLCLACFGGKPPELDVTTTGVGPIDGQTPYDLAHLEGILKGYIVATGNSSLDGRSVSTYRVLLENDEMLEIFPGGDSITIGRVMVKSPDVLDTNGNHVGRIFTDVFGEAPPAGITPGMSEFTGNILCPAPGLSNVTYVFHGDWTGPAGIIPPQNVLDTWTIRYILWKS